MKNPELTKVIEKILTKPKNDEQTKRFIKLIKQGIESKEDWKIEIIKKGLYNLEFQL